MKGLIRKHALLNAVKFNGRADAKAVLGKILSENAELRARAAEVSKEVSEIVAFVNKLSVDEQISELKKIDASLLEEKPKEKEERGLKELDGVGRDFVVRIEPSPSGALHIGHAYGLLVNSEYAKKYKGKLILRIADTNPDNIYAPAYKLIEDDARWLTGNKVWKVVVQSSRMEIYYKYCLELLEKGCAYVCTCDAEAFRKLRGRKEACPCRELDVWEQKRRWELMLKKYKPGEAAVRIKTDMAHKNPALRDWPAFRVNLTKHPIVGKKYRVWPLMNFSVAVDDIELGLTHVINGKDQKDNAEKQKYVFEHLGRERPVYYNWGMINFAGMKLSTTQTRKMIGKGKYSGWDDIRLPFIAALRKRGYMPEAFAKFAVEIGLSENDKSVSKEEFFKILNAFNREVIDEKSNRYFIVLKPKKIRIDGFKGKSVELGLHPDFPKRGKRKLKVGSSVYVSGGEKLAGLVRLMDCINFRKKGGRYAYVSDDYEEYRGAKDRGGIIHYLPEGIKVEVVLESGKRVSGLGERGLLKLKKGEIIQAERVGFVRLIEKKKGKLVFWFLHR